MHPRNVTSCSRDSAHQQHLGTRRFLQHFNGDFWVSTTRFNSWSGKDVLPRKGVGTAPGPSANDPLHPSGTADILTKPEQLCEDAGHFSVKVLHSLINT